MVQLNNTSSSHSPSSCSRDRTCQWEPHAECYHQGRRQLSWLAAERWALLASCYSTFHPLDISALVCHFYLLHHWPLLKFHYSCLTMYLCVSPLSGSTDGNERFSVLWEAQSFPRHVWRFLQVSGNNLRKVVEVSYVDLFITSDVLHCVTVHSWLIHLYYYYFYYFFISDLALLAPAGSPLVLEDL